MLTLKPCLLLCLLSAHLCYATEAEANHKLSGIIQWKYEKRPFCNAFTGCGKKRTSSHPPYPVIKRGDIEDKSLYNSNDYISEGLSDLIDINAEPAVENVQKQIMSQAKIYEAIKEASKEIFRQKNKQRLYNLQQNQLKEEQDKLDDNDNV
ncbi:Cardioactive peptide [Lucilia cuprina]|uniref:Cardioactive peptide n=1 Tax=Lucilia cuprina TaxID=7375 RepID=A0A0L0CD54_LUCCU|nr:cardioactive peptide [Lucilia cuprina]KAI8124690.1 Cardioactive peptide [Lucilia cuprina]KNC30171.1 Cardioactive peptide [Lucilia cuprina]